MNHIFKHEYFFPVLNALGFLAVITVNALANILPINGKNTGELSDLYPNLFVPPGYVFSIWGFIYTLHAIFIFYSFSEAGRSSPLLNKLGWWFLATAALNVIWILFWHYEKVWLSLVVMFLFLATLIQIYLLLEIGNSQLTGMEKLAFHTFFSVYLGWISLATVANVTAALVSAEWNRFGLSEEFWTVLVLLVILALSLSMVLLNNDFAYGGVVIWAAIGIVIKQIGIPSISITASVVVGLTAVGIIYKLIKFR
ncbi:MAG: tryptophan-rich sensory protein [Candidatus Heimdallarchaeota archaeon]|nr:tryptophan-rich sensory protein [Candidatus Heimdallarchaeota archaeon]